MTQPWRIVARRHGGPEVMEREAFDVCEPGAGEAWVRQTAIGVNFIDVYHRSGLYPGPLPVYPGSEAAGVVEAVGPGVSLKPGQRVGMLPRQRRAYATHALVSADTLFALPGGIDDETAAAALLKGVTAWMLVERCARVTAGHTALVHAAAGGVGSLLVQWLKAVGARVIAHAGSAAKAEKARTSGADEALSCRFEDLAGEVRRLTDGAGAQAVFDGVGAASWAASLGSVARRGLIASFGNASGPVPPVPPLALTAAGSIFLTRPTMYDYLDTADARETAASRLFGLIGEGRLKVEIGQRFALADVANAHRALEARQTTGSTILLP